MGPDTVDAKGLRDAPQASIAFEAPSHVVWSRWGPSPAPHHSPHALAGVSCAGRPGSPWAHPPESLTSSVPGGWTHASTQVAVAAAAAVQEVMRQPNVGTCRRSERGILIGIVDFWVIPTGLLFLPSDAEGCVPWPVPVY